MPRSTQGLLYALAVQCLQMASAALYHAITVVAPLSFEWKLQQTVGAYDCQYDGPETGGVGSHSLAIIAFRHLRLEGYRVGPRT